MTRNEILNRISNKKYDCYFNQITSMKNRADILQMALDETIQQINLSLGGVISRFPESEFRTETYTNSSTDFKIQLIHEPSGHSVNNNDLNIKSQYKTKQILKLRLVEKMLLNGL